ncbi:ribonuclease H-like domain-containing protein [Candidatus Dojkabacteria bacterium]|nr:ribonuclease H-like domain-containing protein [Candidatus Dojkabacteria bacterium]
MMIFLDIETQNDWTGGATFSLKELKISYMGVIDEDGKEMDFWEKDMPKLAPILKGASMIVGYNIFGFDMPVIANYLGGEVNYLPQLDLMVAVHRAVGFRPKLDDLTTATFGESKIGHGADAVRYFAAGDFDSLKKYCLEDVRLTKKLYEFGRDHGYVKYYDRSGFVREVKVNWKDGEKLPPEESGMLSMF